MQLGPAMSDRTICTLFMAQCLMLQMGLNLGTLITLVVILSLHQTFLS